MEQARPKKPMKAKYDPPRREGQSKEDAVAEHILSQEKWHNRQNLSAGNNPVHLHMGSGGEPYALVYGPKCKSILKARKAVMIYFKLLSQIPGAQVWRDEKDGQIMAAIPVAKSDFAQIPLYPDPTEGY